MRSRVEKQIVVDGTVGKVVVTEVVPGRWSWILSFGGALAISSSVPAPTCDAAVLAALAFARARALG